MFLLTCMSPFSLNVDDLLRSSLFDSRAFAMPAEDNMRLSPIGENSPLRLRREYWQEALLQVIKGGNNIELSVIIDEREGTKKMEMSDASDGILHCCDHLTIIVVLSTQIHSLQESMEATNKASRSSGISRYNSFAED